MLLKHSFVFLSNGDEWFIELNEISWFRTGQNCPYR